MIMASEEEVVMSMFGPKMGTYTLSSESDSRFNMTFRREGFACTSIPGWILAEVAKKAVELKMERPPEDLSCSFMKD